MQKELYNLNNCKHKFFHTSACVCVCVCVCVQEYENMQCNYSGCTFAKGIHNYSITYLHTKIP